MEETIILNTNDMLPNYDEYTELQQNEERSKINNIASKLDELLNTKKILTSSYNYQTDNAEELNRFTEMFRIEDFNFTNRTIKFPNTNNEMQELFITKIYWSCDGVTIEGNDLASNKTRKISIKKIHTSENNYEFYCLENSVLRPINLILYPDLYDLYSSFEEHIKNINEIITEYQEHFNTLEGLAFLEDETTRFIELCSKGYPIDNLFSICFERVMKAFNDKEDDINEYLNYIVNAYANYLFFIDEVRTWKKYLLDGYIKDENGKWKYHNLHYSRINKLTYNHYVPIGNDFSKCELDKICRDAIMEKNSNCSYSLSKIKRANLIK